MIRRFRRRGGINLMLLARFMPDRRNAPEPAPPWPPFEAEIPADLLTAAGEVRDHQEETRMAKEDPLSEFFTLHPEASEFIISHGRGFLLPSITKLARAVQRVRTATKMKPAKVKLTLDAPHITRNLRDQARRIGLSRIGMTKGDSN